MPSDPLTPEDEEAALRARLARLSGALKDATPPKPAPARPSTAESASAESVGSAMSMGLKAGSEFVAAVILGAAIGWGLDRLFGVKPLFLIVFFMLGVAAGVWNVIRATSPKGASFGHDSRLPLKGAPDKDVRRPTAGPHEPREGG